MRPRLVRDALNAALRKLTFPWLAPHPNSSSREVGYFQKTIKDGELYEMYKRNQLAHNIVYAVAHDALAGEFTVCDSSPRCTLRSCVQACLAREERLGGRIVSCGIRGSVSLSIL